MKNINLQLVILVLLGIFFGLYLYTGEQRDFYNADARPAAERMIKDISQWQIDTLTQHLSTQARATLDDQQLQKLLAHYRQFGDLIEIQVLEFSRLASALSLLGKPRISYQGEARYSQTNTRITITLIVENGHYRIYNFSIHALDLHA